MEEPGKVLDVATLAGQLLLTSGAEIFRVQETMTRIIEHFGLERYNVYVIANGIFANVNEGTDAEERTAIRHVPLAGIHLERIAQVNQIARELCADMCTLREAEARLLRCETPKPQPAWLVVLASGFGAGCFAYLFGGTLLDSCSAFVLGMLLQILNDLLPPLRKYLQLILGAFAVTEVAALAVQFHAPVRFNQVVIGAIMPLVPGTAFTTAIRELFNGDYVSAAVHLLDAITSAGCIAIGVCGAILLVRVMGGVV